MKVLISIIKKYLFPLFFLREAREKLRNVTVFFIYLILSDYIQYVLITDTECSKNSYHSLSKTYSQIKTTKILICDTEYGITIYYIQII